MSLRSQCAHWLWQSVPPFFRGSFMKRWWSHGLLGLYSLQQNGNDHLRGCDNNLLRRMYEHRNHLLPNSFTSKYDVTRLVYYESTSDVYAALTREKQIKGWNRRRKNALVESMNPKWEDLYETILP